MAGKFARDIDIGYPTVGYPTSDVQQVDVVATVTSEATLDAIQEVEEGLEVMKLIKRTNELILGQEVEDSE